MATYGTSKFIHLKINCRNMLNSMTTTTTNKKQNIASSRMLKSEHVIEKEKSVPKKIFVS